MGRRLGQHFLFDPRILERIVDALDPHPTDAVVEVGAGSGSLTKALAPRVARVVALERDPALADHLRAAALPGVHVVEGDALRPDWNTLAGAGTRGPYKVVGNVPYAITSPLVAKALSAPLPEVIVFLVQREVADRLAAEPGTAAYGALTVGVRVVATVDRLFTVKPGSFRPPPRVDSAVVRIEPRSAPLVSPTDHPTFRRFVAAVFSQRRKRLGRCLRSVWELDPAEVERRVIGVGIDPDLRAEVLAPHEFVALHETGPR